MKGGSGNPKQLGEWEGGWGFIGIKE